MSNKGVLIVKDLEIGHALPSEVLDIPGCQVVEEGVNCQIPPFRVLSWRPYPRHLVVEKGVNCEIPP